MAKARSTPEDFARPLRRVLVSLLVLLLLAVFLIWRIDSPRVERFRAALVDALRVFRPRPDYPLAPQAPVSAAHTAGQLLALVRGGAGGEVRP